MPDEQTTDTDTAALPSTAVIIIATEGEQTSDYRIVEEGALTWRNPPLTLTINHDPDRIAGRIDTIRREGASIVGDVVFDLDGVEGAEAARMVDGGFLRGVSMELGDVVAEYECIAEDEDGFCTQELMRVIEGRVGAVTLTPFQALESAEVVSVASMSFTASSLLLASPIEAPAALFADPVFDGPTPLIVDPESRRVYGHVAYWGVCHRGINDRCVLAPRSSNGYAHFGKPRQTTDGAVLRVGPLSLDGLHAPASVRGLDARVRWYEDTTTVAADVAIGEDEHGVWVSGRLRSYVTGEQVERLAGAEVSGDWWDGKNLCFLHAVVTPGFVSTKVTVGPDGDVVALAASFTGRVPKKGPGCGCDDTVDAASLGHRVASIEAVIAALGLGDAAVDALAASLASGGDTPALLSRIAEPRTA